MTTVTAILQELLTEKSGKQILYIFGEAHFNHSDRLRITNEIRRIKPKILAHELLYEDVCYNSQEINKRLSNCKDGGICDPGLNKDIYLLGKELNMQLVGIDLNNSGAGSLEQQFKKREKHMVSMLEKLLVRSEENGDIIVAVIGDTHLRSIQTNELGPMSPILTKFKNNPLVTIIRTDITNREID